MPHDETPDFDVAIIGGGPAGSATAAYLARGGLRCVVLERERFPREHVGESLVPSTTRIFKELDFLEEMERAGFPHKYGAAWTSELQKPTYSMDWDGLDPECNAAVRFEERQQEGVPQNYTYHVDRAKFDELLLRHAEKLGATVWEESVVRGVDLGASDSPVAVTYSRDGKESVLRAGMLVDASGRRAFLGTRLGLKTTDPVFDQYALHTWFDGFDRGDGIQSDYIFIHFLPVTNTWMWQIPITDTITSIGVVTQKNNFSQARTLMDEFFWDSIKTGPELFKGLRASRQLRPLKPEGDYSYAMRHFCGDRWLLVGDAARFVDPIFSSGVSIALTSARLASQAILEAAGAGDFSEARFSEFESTMKKGCEHWYEFIRLYYRLLFTYFVSNPSYRLEVLRLLQGDVYDEQEPEVLAKMREVVKEVEETPAHVWHSLLGGLSSEMLRPVT